MAKDKSYSPEAIQGRQQVAVDEYNRRKEKLVKAEQPAEQPKPKTQAQPLSGAPNYSLLAGNNPYNLPVVPQTKPTVPASPPWGAQGMANVTTILGTQGQEPIYNTSRPREGWLGVFDAAIGNPFKNWAKRTFSEIHDPKNFIPAPTPEQKKEIEARVQKYQNTPMTTYHGYAEKALGRDISNEEQAQAMMKVSGIDLNLVFEAKATQDVAKETGDVNVGAIVATKTIKKVAGSLAMGVLGAPEWVVRNGAAIVKTVDDIADDVSGADKDRIEDRIDTTGIDKFNKALKESEFNFFLSRVPALMLLQNYDFLNVAKKLNPYDFFKDAGRLVVNMDKVKPGQFVNRLSENLAGSQMIFSMFRESTIEAEYERRYAEGESPQVLVQELQDPMTELIGGVLYDPTTWIGGGMIDDAGKSIVKSAARSNIDNALLDTRVSQPILDGIDDFVKNTKKVQDKQQILDGIQKAFKVTADQYEIWRNKRGITQLTSSGKQAQVIEQATDLFRNLAARAASIPDGMDEMVKTIRSMKNLAQGKGTEEAFLQLAKTPLGNMPLSPRGMRTAHLLAGLDDDMAKFEKAIESGDVKQLADLYASGVEKTIKKTILSVDEMKDAAKQVKALKAAGEEIPTALQKTADEYAELSPVVKFVNGANNVGQKTWMKPMSFLSEVYFGVNRFAYPTRNVLGSMIGLAYEFGLTDAVEIGVKSVTGSQIEPIGIKTLNASLAGIEEVLGYIPEAAKRGGIPTDGIVDTTKKGFLGLFGLRSGSQVAQLSEQLMSAQIMLKTVRQEMKKALKSGNIPDPTDLIRAGLNSDDAKVLLQYAVEHGGNTDKAVAAFRKYMDGADEAYRHLPMPEKMDGFLESLGSGSQNLKRELQTVMETARTADEFIAESRKVWNKAEAMGAISRSEPVQLSDDLTKEFGGELNEVRMLNEKGVASASPEVLDSFERTVQAFENAKREWVAVEESLKAFFYKQLPDSAAERGGVFASLRSAAEKTTPDVDSVRKIVNEIKDNKNLTPQEMYDLLEKSKMQISKLSDVDPSKLTRRQMENIMWDSYFFWRSERYAARLNDYVAGTSAVFESMADDLGTTIPDIAKNSGIQWQKAKKSFDDAYQYYNQSAIDTMSFTRAKVPTGVNMTQLEMTASELKKYGYSSKTHLFNSINKYRREHGLGQWTDFSQVDMWEVQDAIRRFKRSQGFIPSQKAGIPDADKITRKIELAADEYVDEMGVVRKKDVQKFDFPTSEEKAAKLKDIEGTLQSVKERAKQLKTQNAASVAPPPTTVQDAIKAPRSELPEDVSVRFEQEARRLLSELSGGEAGKRTAEGSFGTTNVSWYRELYAKGMNRKTIDTALEKIVKDKGADKGVSVEKMKDFILDNFMYGDATNGVPPDLNIMRQLGASDEKMQTALDAYNDITKQEVSLEEAIRQSTSGETSQLSIDKNLPYFDDAGNLIMPKGLDLEFIPMKHPPIAPDKSVTQSRMIQESLPNASPDFEAYIQEVAKRWGETNPPKGQMDDAIEIALAKWSGEMRNRMGVAKTEAGTIATAMRDALLYDYRKPLWSVAAQYISPFNYYHASASRQWLQNVAADPKWGAIYVDYKEYMAEKHAGLPDFWKQNIAVSGLPGMDKDNPVFFNIESSVNPLYQMIGQDFNDPDRRKDWLSSTIDSLGTAIPGIYQPLQWAVAANLYAKGEAEAGARWLGRLIPQTKIIKSVSTALGINIPGTKHNELDPFVGLLMDGLDPWEEKRVLRYLATMPGLTEEQRIEAAHAREGENWDAAVNGALKQRALPETASFFLGVGYKPRTQSDIQTDQFYDDYRKLLAARSIMPPDEYKDAWDAIREKYPFMDTLLIGKRAGEERDSAMAYNVLNRVPPGEMTDIAEVLGVKPYMLQQFYDNNGDLSKMTPQDRQRFMGAILDLSAMLKMPTAATRQEWNSAKETYASMNEALKKTYGNDILEKIDRMYDLPEKDWDAYLEANPEVQFAMRDKDAYVTNTPILSAYYGSLDTVSRYYNSQVYVQLEKEFGKNIADVWEQYKALNFNEDAEMLYYQKNKLGDYESRKSELDTQVKEQLAQEFGEDIYQKINEYNILKYQDKEAAKAYRKENLKAYYDRRDDLNDGVKKQLTAEFKNIDAILAQYNILKEKKNAQAEKFYYDNNLDKYEARKQELFDEADPKIQGTAKNIPEGEGYSIRPDFETQSGYQEDALNYATTDPQAELAAEIWSQLLPAAQALLTESFQTGEPVPSAVTRQVKYIADKYGMSEYEAMRLLGVEQ